MHQTMRVLARLLCAAAFVAFCAPAFAQAVQPVAKVPLENFFQNRFISQVGLSPDGQHLAMLVASANGRVRLATAVAGSSEPPRAIAGFNDADVRSFHWVNNNRLVFDTVDHQTAQGDIKQGPGLFAVNRDGSEPLLLVRRGAAGDRWVLPSGYHFHSVVRGELGDEIYVYGIRGSRRGDFETMVLVRMNTVTGRYAVVEPPGTRVVSWLMDAQGQPRMVVTLDKRLVSVLYSDPANKNDWRKLTEFDVFAKDSFAPLEFGADGKLYVSARQGGDKAGIYTYDLANNRIDPQPVAMLKNYDLGGPLITNQQGVLGVRYVAASPNTFWFDDKLKRVQQAVDQQLPGTVNNVSLASRSHGARAVVYAGSDTLPGNYYLYDIAANKLTPIGNAMPQIDPETMSDKELVHYAARDGLDIPAYLTLPRGSSGKNLPLVVLVHGGPNVRGSNWMWNPEVQFLASRGYAVLQPEYRGSTGFGEKHFRAGWKQWGLKMQDDIADGARWAIAKGIADPKRICIAGASYGGYATLMGLVNDPDLYRCGVNWLGVTDISLMYSVFWSDTSEEAKLYGMPAMVGDPEKDAAQLKATSPLEQAARIKQPLLLAYGGADRRVPIIHGNKFHEAVKATNPNVEWISYKEEGHGWALVKNRVDFWQRVEAFLDRNIGPNAGSPAKSPAPAGQ